jgi:peptide/nickel transport system substrate-binding protein
MSATTIRSLTILIPLAIVLAACGGPSSEPTTTAETPSAAAEPDTPKVGETEPAVEDETPVDGDWIIMQLSAEMENLNPFTSTDAYSSAITGHIFDTLVRLDYETLEIIPELAESWETSEDHLSYTFTLKEGVRFSDGVPLTAEDIRWTFETIKDPNTDAPHMRNYYNDVVSCEVIDARTVKFTCDKPYFRHLFVLGALDVVPKHIYGTGNVNDHPNDRTPVGSGAYVLEEWQTGQQVVLARNENYWGEKPHILKRVYKIIVNEEAAFQVLARGEMDTMGLTAEQWVERGSKPSFEEKFNKFKYNQNGYIYIGWNIRRPLFNDKRVRQALTMLVDRELVRDEIYYGFATITTGNFFIDEPEYNQDIEPWPFDPERAAALLDEAGWFDSDGDGLRDKNGVPFRFETLLTNESAQGEKICTLLQEELAAAGIEMTLRQMEWASLLENIHQLKFDACLMGWGLPPYPDPYQVWHSTQTGIRGSNHVGFINDEADRIIEDGRLEFDREKRVALYHRFHEILHEEQPYTFLFCRKALTAADKRFRNTKVYPYGMYNIEWWVPAELQRYH